MNAINHAATALLINRRWPGVPMLPVLISVQLVELLWVLLNFAGVEQVSTEPTVRSLADIHLAYMPYSHSVAAGLVIAATVALATAALGRPRWSWALAAGVLSHTLLDLATHAQDMALAPGLAAPKLGSGLYDLPPLAWLVETLYGIGCWWLFRGSRALLAAILAFQLGALSFYSAAIPGPEAWLGGHPLAFVAMIGVHTIAGLVVVGLLARPQWRGTDESN